MALLGLTSNTSRPAFAAMTADIVPPADRVRAFSLNYWAINLGFAIAPALGGVLATSGYLTLFLVDEFNERLVSETAGRTFAT